MKLTKICTSCFQELSFDHFQKQSANKDGLKYICRACSNAKVLASYHKNPQHYISKISEHRKANKEHYREYRREYMKKYRKTNIEEQFKRKMANKIRKKLHSKEGVKTSEFLGCSATELRNHLEKQFTPEMTWENYGSVWHIDHIIPCAAFEPTIEEMKKCWHYTNLRPLLAALNQAKSNFYNGTRVSWK